MGLSMSDFVGPTATPTTRFRVLGPRQINGMMIWTVHKIIAGGRVGKQVAQCLDTACNQAVVEERIRKLTPIECLRLQDFNDDFKIVISDSQAYKQAGNSMSVNILEMIFNQIEKAKVGECRNSLLDFMGENNE